MARYRFPRRIPPPACSICKKWGKLCRPGYPLCLNLDWKHGPQFSSSAPKDKSRIISREPKGQWAGFGFARYWKVQPIEHPIWKKKRFLPNRLRQKRKPR